MRIIIFLIMISLSFSLFAMEKTLSDTNVPENRNKIPQLINRTFGYMNITLGKLGMGWSLPGMKTYEKQMQKYNELETRVSQSNLAEDKKKHILTCAKIASKTKAITGSSGIAYLVTMTIGLGKEIYDKSFLNPTGGRDYTDLDADAVGAEIVYEKPLPTFENAPDLDISDTMDSRYLSQLRKTLTKYQRKYAELISDGKIEESQELYLEKIQPLEEEILRIEKK